MRIVSLLPGATRLVEQLGLGERLVGISHACRPSGRRAIPRVSRSRIPQGLSAAETDAAVRRLLGAGVPLFELDETLLVALDPDVVITQSLCQVCAFDGRELAGFVSRELPHASLVEFSPTTLDDVMVGITRLGAAVGCPREAVALSRQMRSRLFELCVAGCFLGGPTAVFLEWIDPLFCAGHWVPQLVQVAGGRELLGKAGERSFQVTPERLLNADPDVLLIGCCGWPAARTRAELDCVSRTSWWRRLRCVRNDAVFVLDAAEAFTQPDAGLVEAARTLAGVFRSYALRDWGFRGCVSDRASAMAGLPGVWRWQGASR